MSTKALRKWALMLTFWLAMQFGRVHADTVSGDSNVTGKLDVQGTDLSVGTNAATTDWGVDLVYTDGTSSYLDFIASRSNTWRWKQTVSSSFKIQMTLDSSNKLSLFDSTGTAQIILDPNPANTSTIAGSLTVNGSDSEMPNQTLVNNNSVLTQGLADQRYPNTTNGVLYSYGGFALFGGSTDGLQSVAMGTGTSSHGWNSFASGEATTASGNYAVAIGFGTTANGQSSMAMGNAAISTGQNSAAIGDTLNSYAFDSLAVGRCNMGGGNPTSWVATDPLFEVGNGTPGAGEADGQFLYTLSSYYSAGFPTEAWLTNPGPDFQGADDSTFAMQSGITSVANNDTGEFVYTPSDPPPLTGYYVWTETDYWIPPVDLEHIDAFLVKKNGDAEIQHKLSTGSDITTKGDVIAAGVITAGDGGLAGDAVRSGGNVTATGNVTAGGNLSGSTVTAGSVTSSGNLTVGGNVTAQTITITAPAGDIPMYDGSN